MKVNLFVSKDVEEPYAEIHTNELNENITKAMSILENDESNELLAVKKDSDIALLEYDDIFMFRVENKQVNVFTKDYDYIIKKPLYQIEENLNSDFVRISKTTIVNLKRLKE